MLKKQGNIIHRWGSSRHLNLRILQLENEDFENMKILTYLRITFERVYVIALRR